MPGEYPTTQTIEPHQEHSQELVPDSLCRQEASLNRRQILEGLAAAGTITVTLAALGPSANAASRTDLGSTTDAPLPADVFLAASSILTGLPLDRSYLELSEAVMAALIAEGVAARELHQITAVIINSGDQWHQALEDRRMIPMAAKIALIWYTGMTNYTPDDKSKSTVITYDNALAWRACSFTKPPANCGGPFGYWYDPA